ncbi:MFS transporter [Leucobacter sp. W1153]|uniref:MFS transporter n=1 Tax=unclassified Leucobacter TaxID=2621730 RepID=UPI003F363309
MRPSRTLLPWVVWGVAALAYAVAVINRSSLSALGPAAQEHFGIDATTLATFATLQLVVYAGLQIPVGVLLDRFGSTVMILTGGVLMLVGQLLMATVFDVSLAILARVLVGAGDACTFISVMRMLPAWFALRQLPIVGQATGLIGQTGQLVSVTPLALVVGKFGWMPGFLGIAAVGFLVLLLGTLVLRDFPQAGTVLERMTGRLGRTSRHARSLGDAENATELTALAPPATAMMATVVAGRARRVPGIGFVEKSRRLLSIPGVRLAYWLHFTVPFSANVFILLWGTPFLIGGVGLSAPAASGLLSLMIVSSMMGGVMLGPLSSRFIERRVRMVIGIAVMITVAWLITLLWPGTPPVWLMAGLMFVIAVGGPASMIAFEVARSHTPRSFGGFSTGLVNTAGFTSSLLVIFLIGFALDLLGAGSPASYTLDAFRWAFAVQIPFLLLGITMMLVEERRTVRWMREHGRRLR